MDDKAPLSRREELRRSVTVGADGFLFQRFNSAFEQLCGEFTLDEEQIDRWVSLLESRHAWCRMHGIGYYFLAVPEKHVVYDDKLPVGFAISKRRPVLQISSAIAAAVEKNFIYPEPTLREGRNQFDTFYRTDVHWTWYGAYLGYVELLKRLGDTVSLAPVPLEALELSSFRMVGDLGVRLDPQPYEVGVRARHAGERQFRRVFGNSAFGRGQVEVFENEDLSLPRAVMFRDSNATAMLPFMGTNFSRLVLVSATQMFHQIVRSERPDFVITQMTERYMAEPNGRELVNFPDEFGMEGFRSFTQTMLPLPTSSDDLLIDFGAAGNSIDYRRAGWRNQEPEHVWAVGPKSSIAIKELKPGTDYEMQIEASAFFVPPVLPHQTLCVMLGDTSIATFQVSQFTLLRCVLPNELIQQPTEISFSHPNCKSPVALGVGGDDNLLAICFKTIRLRAIPRS